MFQGLRTAIYPVHDLEEGKRWYSQALETEPYFDEPFYVGFNVAGYELGLLPEDETSKSGSTGVRTYWGVEDIEAEYARLLAIGAREHTPIQDVGPLVATLLDPFGNILGLIHNPDFTLEG